MDSRVAEFAIKTIFLLKGKYALMIASHVALINIALLLIINPEILSIMKKNRFVYSNPGDNIINDNYTI